MTTISLKNAAFEGNLLFDQTALFLKSVLPGRAKVEYSAQTQAFSVLIDKYLVQLSPHQHSVQTSALELKNIASLSIKELKNDWFRLSTNISSYWVHRQLRQRCDFIAYTQPPASFDFEKERNNRFGCTTHGCMIPRYAHSAKMSLSKNVTTIDTAKVSLRWASSGVSDVNYIVEKGEGAFAYRLGLRYTDDKQNASMLLINKKNVTKQEEGRNGRVIAYKDTVLRTDSIGERAIRVRTDEELYKPLVVVVPEGWHCMIEEPAVPLSQEQLERYAAEARADRDAREPRKVVLCAGYYDPVTGQSIE